jgi:hypothetical protein
VLPLNGLIPKCNPVLSVLYLPFAFPSTINLWKGSRRPKENIILEPLNVFWKYRYKYRVYKNETETNVDSLLADLLQDVGFLRVYTSTQEASRCISHLVASLPTTRQQIVFALLVPSCQQVWNKLLTTCNNLVDIIRLVARLFNLVDIIRLVARLFNLVDIIRLVARLFQVVRYSHE